MNSRTAPAARRPNNASLPATQQRHPETANFPQMLMRYRQQIATALPAHIDPDRMVRIALTCFRTVPKLSSADPASIFAAVIQAAQAGLEPGSIGGECHLVPRWSEREGRYTASLQVGYKGYIKLARQSGLIADIVARVVHRQDEFSLELGTTEQLIHRPHLGSDRGEPVVAYCIATFTNGHKQIEVMPWCDVLAVRDKHAPRDRGGNITGPWAEHLVPMAIKTVIRRAAKLWPQSAELQLALAADGRELSRHETDSILTGRTIDLEDGSVIDLPASTDHTAMLEQQIGDADSVEQLDHLAGMIDQHGIQGRDAKRLRDAIRDRAASLAPPRATTTARPAQREHRAPTFEQLLGQVDAATSDEVLDLVRSEAKEALPAKEYDVIVAAIGKRIETLRGDA